MHAKTFLSLDLGTDPKSSIIALQQIKDAMTAAILSQAQQNGTIDIANPFYQVYQSIYLQAHHQQQQYIVADPEGQ